MITSSQFTGITLLGIHGHQEIRQPLGDGLNILFGKNGSGKTTFLHVIANLLERDFERFCYVRFDEIEAITSGGTEVRLRQYGSWPDPSIEVTLDGKIIGNVKRDDPALGEIETALRNVLGGRPVYLPAFRPILEATYTNRRTFSPGEREENEAEIHKIMKRESYDEEQVRNFYRNPYPYMQRDRAEMVAQKTLLCRRWFGKFVPIIRYPSLNNIQIEIISELEQARFDIHKADQRILSSVFLKVIESIVSDRTPPQNAADEGDASDSDLEHTMREVQRHLAILNPVQTTESDIYTELARLVEKYKSGDDPAETSLFKRVLAVYEEALSERTVIQTSSYAPIKLFQRSVNQFLEGKDDSRDDGLVGAKSSPSGKRLELNYGPTSTRRDLEPRIRLANGDVTGLQVLSSGERHVLSLIFSATHMRSSDGIVLIDEPELSLHVDWQRIILGEILKQAGGRQVIACTHSPEVAAEHITNLRELAPRPWVSRSVAEQPVDDAGSVLDEESES
jgi:ABC-type transport system involved in cytochrome c biogenesis ATPase subunit